MIWSANIPTTTAKTNHFISQLYPLVVSAAEVTVRRPVSERSYLSVHPKRPVREAAKKG